MTKKERNAMKVMYRKCFQRFYMILKDTQQLYFRKVYWVHMYIPTETDLIEKLTKIKNRF